MRKCLLHLVTGESARNENAVEECIGIDFPHAGKPGKRMYIKPVAAIYHSNGFAARHRMGSHLERQLENGSLAVQ